MLLLVGREQLRVSGACWQGQVGEMGRVSRCAQQVSALSRCSFECVGIVRLGLRRKASPEMQPKGAVAAP